jgi:uncharacterized protein YggE
MEQENINSVCDLCHHSSVAKLLALFLGILSLFFLVKTYGTLKENSFVGQDIYPQTTISVQGEGEVSAVPDIANFGFLVTDEQLTVKEAQQNVNGIMANVVSYLKGAGIDEENIKTTGYNIYPRYEWKNLGVACYGLNCPPVNRERVLIGYEVSQNVAVKLEDIDKAGEILSGIGALEVTNVSGLTFDIDNKDELKRQARQDAIEDAKNKAKQLAKDLGIDLVRMISYSANDDNNYLVYSKDRAYAVNESSVGSAAVVPVGENEIKVNVNLTYEIK